MVYENKYDADEIIDRIKKEIELIKKDKSNPINSQDDFFDTSKDGLVDYSKQSLSKCKKNHVLPPFNTMIEFCNAFDCELGYLLGEYPEKHRNQDIVKAVLLLSHEAIEYLTRNGKNSIISSDNVPDIDGILKEAVGIEKQEPCQREQFANIVNMLIAEFPEVIETIGKILLHDELNLNTNGLRKKEPSSRLSIMQSQKKFDIDDAVLNLALQVKFYHDKKSKIQPHRITSKVKHDFVVDLLKTQFEKLENDCAELASIAFSRLYDD